MLFMKYLIISGSLSKNSKSRILAKTAYELLNTKAAADYIDLRDFPLPLCDGSSSFNHPNVKKLQHKIAQAEGILLATPVYNYDVNSALKNLVENTGDVWEGKILGFLVAAGGNLSYMSAMNFAVSMMFEYRCTIIPRYVFATGADFNAEGQPQEKIIERIQQLNDSLLHYVKGLKKED